MDQLELFFLLRRLRAAIDRRELKIGRTREQIADIHDRNIESMWKTITGKDIDIIQFPAKGEKVEDEPVVGCTTISLGERTTLPDNRIGFCQWGCERMIQWRPYVPDHITKVCLYCMVERAESGDQ
jgi:hypothetical protein